MLLCGLTSRSYLIYSLADFSYKSIDIEGPPIQDMKQYANYVIATQRHDESNTRTLCRLRPVGYDAQALFLEMSQITGCNAILQYSTQSQKFFGFNSDKKAFVSFKLEELRPYKVDCKVYEIVQDLQYVSFTSNFDFSKPVTLNLELGN